MEKKISSLNLKAACSYVIVQPPLPWTFLQRPNQRHPDRHVEQPNKENEQASRQEDAISERTANPVEGTQLPSEMVELDVGPRQQVPRLQLLRLKSLGHLIFNDGGNAGPDIVENVGELKLSLKGRGRDCSSVDEAFCHAVISVFDLLLQPLLLSLVVLRKDNRVHRVQNDVVFPANDVVPGDKTRQSARGLGGAIHLRGNGSPDEERLILKHSMRRSGQSY